MPIVGFNFNKIVAENKNESFKGSININTTIPHIKNIERKDDVAGLKDILAIEFILTISYEPKIGQIDLSGEVLYQGENSKKIQKTWKEKKILDEEVALDILNHIFRRSIIKAFSISDDVRLPPPINIPAMIKEGQQKTTTAG